MTLAVVATRRPAPVRVRLHGAAASVTRRVMVWRRYGRLVTVHGLAPGAYRWVVTSPTAARVAGRVRVVDAPAPDPVPRTPQPTTTPRATVSPTPSAVPTPAPAPRPASAAAGTAADTGAEPRPEPAHPHPRPRRPRNRPPDPDRLTREAPPMSIPSIGTRAAWVVALVLATGGAALAPVGVSASAPGDRASSHWAGFRIPRNGHADGGWIGGYRVRGEPAFVTTPRARPNTRGYQARDVVGNYREKKGATRSETARAAWILSKYGGYRDATQAAAVDATVYHLLVGKQWRIDGDRGGRRIRQTGQPSTVRRFARIMLRQAARSAGAYGVAIRSTGADVGGTVTGAVTVTDGKGAPVAGLPVTLRSPGADPVAAVTGDDGVALARFPAPVAGWQQIAATVSQVPEHRLHLLVPKRRHQATAAVGGVRRTLTASTTAPVRGPQALSLKASPEIILAGAKTAVTATVAGDGSAAHGHRVVARALRLGLRRELRRTRGGDA